MSMRDHESRCYFGRVELKEGGLGGRCDLPLLVPSMTQLLLSWQLSYSTGGLFQYVSGSTLANAVCFKQVSLKGDTVDLWQSF